MHGSPAKLLNHQDTAPWRGGDVRGTLGEGLQTLMNTSEVLQSPTKSRKVYEHMRITLDVCVTPLHTFAHLCTPSCTFMHLHSTRTILGTNRDLNRWPIRVTLHGGSPFAPFWHHIHMGTHSQCFVTWFLVHSSTSCKEYLRVFSLVFFCKVRVIHL
jgi:hypothetical protein